MDKAAKAPALPQQQIQHVELERLEHAVYARDHEQATELMLECFNRLRQGGMFAWLRTDEGALNSYFARLTAALTALISDPEFQFSDDGFLRLSVQAGVIAAIFEASPLDNGDHMARALSDNPQERDPSQFRFNSATLAKWLLFWGMNSAISVDFKRFFEAATPVALPLWAAWISNVCVLTKLASDRRDELLRLGPCFERQVLPDPVLPAISDAYMYSSYAPIPDRHEVKRSINAMYRNTVAARVPNMPSAVDLKARRIQNLTEKSKPTILVPLEWFGSYHAMFRCYAPMIAQLRPRFRLVASIRPSQIDAAARAYFDDILPLPEGPVFLDDIARKVLKLAPAMVYYPSVGMAMWWTIFSAVRLAPIQLMTLGHPASTLSDSMDYVLSEEPSISDPALFSERAVLLPDRSGTFAQRPDMKLMADAREIMHNRPQDGVVRIAVPAMSLKLSLPFLEVLSRVGLKAFASGTTVEYHFFPNATGVFLAQMRKQLRRMLPGAVVRPRADYAQYLKWIAECDFAVVPFPFGGTNSTVDTLMMGIPTLSPLGPQPHERFDAILLRRVGCGDMVSETHEAYEEAIFAAVMNPGQVGIWRGALAAKNPEIEAEFYDTPPAPAAGAFGRAFNHIYENHEAIVASGARSIHWKEFTPDGS